ncbi:unnamed protein product [Cylicostephanus goldi]|uniref:Uncharacterized protein n=1 Tax=Cylicostephanus goldi TaxID=71465 RepID=A0A3P6SD61_CYLGO|nr:unnamed protein product [Cylicostephanus goldi]
MARDTCGNHVLNTAENVRGDQTDIASKFSTKNLAVDINASALEAALLNQKIYVIKLPALWDYDSKLWLLHNGGMSAVIPYHFQQSIFVL